MKITKTFTQVLLMLGLLFSEESSGQNNFRVQNFLLTDVQLLESPFKKARDLNIKILLEYDVDRLLAPYLKEAGLPAKAESFPNWIGLDGHVGGHYLSALSINYAATGDHECKRRLDYMVAELKKCQDKNGNGYAGGVPNGMETVWNKVRTGDPLAVSKAWAPWYNVHKMYAGLRDAWELGKNKAAKDVFLKFCDWGISVIAPLNAHQMEQMLDTEFGGMNEVYADAYQMTGNRKYLEAAKRFSHKVLFDSMLKGIDNLDNKHANTQIPKAVGYQRVSEVSNDEDYRKSALFFWETVVNNRSLAFGGNSRREHFPSADACSEYIEEREGPESCNTYNMLKLTEGLFRANPEAKYADYYERAMYNHILSTQHPGHGGYVYFTSSRPRHYRVYSSVNEAMWCCVGTGMENHGKYGEFIYSHSDDDVYVNLFVASQLNWRAQKLRIKQETSFPFDEKTKLTLTLNKPRKFSMWLRHPSWIATDDFAIEVNGVTLEVTSAPSSYVEINRIWKDGDVIEMSLPMKTRIEEMPNVPDYISVFHGPVLLGARTGSEDLEKLVGDEGRWAHIAGGTLLPVTEAPFFVGERDEIFRRLSSMKPVTGMPLMFTCPEVIYQEKFRDLVFEPFFKIHDSRYMMYWHAIKPGAYEKLKEEQVKKEQEKIVLDRRTVDFVKPGEQQPETDHQLKASNSNTGYHKGESFRDAASGGYFSYKLSTSNEKNLLLRIRFWGNETGNRQFGIYIDDKLLTTENIADKWNRDEFVDVDYPLPAALIKDKEFIRVRFQADEQAYAGGVFYLRLMKPDR